MAIPNVFFFLLSGNYYRNKGKIGDPSSQTHSFWHLSKKDVPGETIAENGVLMHL